MKSGRRRTLFTDSSRWITYASIIHNRDLVSVTLSGAQTHAFVKHT